MKASPSEALYHPIREHIIARPEQESRRLEVDIEARTLHPRARTFPKIESQVGFVRGFVEAKTGIAVKAKDGFVDPGNGHDVWRNLFQPAAHVYDEGFGRGQDMALVDVPVCFEPLPVVVFFQPPEKGDRLSAEPPET